MRVLSLGVLPALMHSNRLYPLRLQFILPPPPLLPELSCLHSDIVRAGGDAFAEEPPSFDVHLSKALMELVTNISHSEADESSVGKFYCIMAARFNLIAECQRALVTASENERPDIAKLTERLGLMQGDFVLDYSSVLQLFPRNEKQDTDGTAVGHQRVGSAPSGTESQQSERIKQLEQEKEQLSHYNTLLQEKVARLEQENQSK